MRILLPITESLVDVLLGGHSGCLLLHLRSPDVLGTHFLLCLHSKWPFSGRSSALVIAVAREDECVHTAARPHRDTDPLRPLWT